MNHYRALVLNPDKSFELQMFDQEPDIELRSAKSIEQLNEEVNKGIVDVVVLYETPELSGFDLLRKVRQQKPDIPAILLVAPASGAWRQAINDQRTELVSNPTRPPELKHRIGRLLSQIQRAAPAIPIGQSLTKAVAELRSTKSGKLDARLISEEFGLTEADIARSINKKPQTINATPDSDGLQELLYPYERIASAIKYTTGSLQPALKIWLQAPNPTMPNTPPIVLIRKGHVAELADLWDDTMLGQPD
jgi:DNA-binding response OmpR family regulator